MRRIYLLPVLTLLSVVVVLPVGTLSGQSAPQPGDALIIGQDYTRTSVWGTVGYLPAGGATTLHVLHRLPVDIFMHAATAAPGNDGVLFTGLTAQPPLQAVVFHLDANRVLRTTATYPTTFGAITDVVVNDADDLYLVSSRWSTARTFDIVYRTSLANPTKLTTVYVHSDPLRYLYRLNIDPITGDLVMMGQMFYIVRQAQSGAVTSIRCNVTTFANGPCCGFDVMRPQDGAYFAGRGWGLFRIDANTGSFTTLVPDVPVGPRFFDLDLDPVNGQAYWIGHYTALRLDLDTVRTTTLMSWSPSHFSCYNVVTWLSRELSGRNAPTIGTTYRVLLSMPAEAGRVYQAAAAFGTRQGIVTPAGRIPLDPDPLFFLSVDSPSPFQGFSGLLSASGTAELRIPIPASRALQGLRFHLAAITVANKAIARISEPFGVTIR